jgi:hypothetical protein
LLTYYVFPHPGGDYKTLSWVAMKYKVIPPEGCKKR